jgi:hypothetical protein
VRPWVDVVEPHAGELCAARYLAHPVLLERDAAIAAHVLGGAAAELPAALAARLDGYRLRAGLGPLPGVPEVLAGGVRRVKLGLPAVAAAYGYPFAALRAYPGSPLPEVRDLLAAEDRRRVLIGIVRIVGALHGRGVAHGALEPGAFAAAGATVTLVDLGPLQTTGELAADRSAVAELAGWLLGDAAPDPEALWASAAEPADPDGTIVVPDD